MISPEDMAYRYAVRDVGVRVHERYSMGEPLKVPYCGKPLIRVDMIVPLEYEMLSVNMAPYITEAVYPLAAVIPYSYPNRDVGAAMILHTRFGLMGSRIVNCSMLNEIGKEVGGFCSFDRI